LLSFLVLVSGGIAVSPARGSDAPGVGWPDKPKRGSISSSSPFRGSPITIGFSSRTAGAIDSLTWRQHQFVNSNDHGREFQSASSFDGKGECFNPTEAGSASDGTGGNSTSKLLSVQIGNGEFATKSMMAFWIGPGGQSSNCHGTISTVASPLSEDTLTKNVAIGAYDIPNAIQYRVTFGIPDQRRQGGFEAITGYMPPEFNRFWTFDPANDTLSRQGPGHGAQSLPLVVSTGDGNFALGIVTPANPAVDQTAQQHVYGRWDFTQPSMASPTIKWNSYFKVPVVVAGNHSFTSYLVIGSLDDVRSGMSALCLRLQPLTC